MIVEQDFREKLNILEIVFFDKLVKIKKVDDFVVIKYKWNSNEVV